MGRISSVRCQEKSLANGQMGSRLKPYKGHMPANPFKQDPKIWHEEEPAPTETVPEIRHEEEPTPTETAPVSVRTEPDKPGVTNK